MLNRVKTTKNVLYMDVCNEIKAYISGHGLRPGDRLPTEPRLCQELGVSRTVLREGMKSLETLGIVSIEVGRGTFVRNFDFTTITQQIPHALAISETDLSELVEIRMLLEVHCLGLAMDGLTAADIGTLRDCVGRMRELASAGQDFVGPDTEFHRTIAGLAGKRLVMMLLDIFWDFRSRMLLEPEDLMRSCDEHEAIVDAMERGDRRGAEEALRRSLESFRNILEK